MTLTNRSPNVSRPHSPLLAAATAALLMAGLAAPARAQYRVGSDGHANDANPRYGSGGYNSGGSNSGLSNLNNQLINGNVSGLNYFHGGVNSFDPNVGQFNSNDQAFQAFTNASAPVNYAHPSNGQANYTPVYSQQNYVGPVPTNFTPTQNNVAYIPTAQADPSALTSDTRLQNLNKSPQDLQGSNLATPGTLDAPGQVNNVGNQSLYSMSPLYGYREVAAGDQTQDNLFVSRYGNVGRPGAGPRMSPQDIEKLRQQVRDSATETTGNAKTPGDAATDPDAPTGTNPSAVGTLGHAVRAESIAGTAVNQQALSASVSAQPVASTVGATPISTLQQTLLIPPGQQSKQLAELERRFAAANPRPTAEQSANERNRVLIAYRKAKEAKLAAIDKPADGTDPAKPASGGSRAQMIAGGHSGTSAAAQTDGSKVDLSPVVHAPAAPAVAAPAQAVPDAPYQITSLAADIKAKGLHDLLDTAERQMRGGQFGQAVDTYDTAAEVAPTNPFVPLGRGFAELAASYYGKAEADLTRAFLNEPAVLAGQYDLKGFLGQDRLTFVQKDLTDIGATEQTARPFLLLAFIVHQGGDDATTAKHLDTAEARGADPRVVSLMREAWNLRAAPAK